MIEILRQVPVFQQLSDAELQDLLQAGEQRSLASGEMVFHQGDEPDGAYVLLEGRVSVFRPNAAGREIQLGTFEPGSLFGEMALVDSMPRSASVSCLEDSRFLLMTGPTLFDSLRASEQGLIAAMSTLCRRIRDSNERYHEEMLQGERQKSEMELQRHRSLARMVVGVAHEVNTPLGIVNSATSVVTELVAQLEATGMGDTDEETAECLTDLKEAARLISGNISRASSLIGRFRNLSRHQMFEASETVILADCVDEALGLYSLEARKAKIDIQFLNHVPAGSEWTGPPGYIEQILMNLLTNAQRYAYGPEGGVVEVELRKSSGAEDAGFELIVRDFGRGISESDQTQVFEPFFTTGRAQGGTGLGLSIVRTLVIESLDGDITLASEPGLTEFRIHIPRLCATES